MWVVVSSTFSCGVVRTDSCRSQTHHRQCLYPRMKWEETQCSVRTLFPTIQCMLVRTEIVPMTCMSLPGYVCTNHTAPSDCERAVRPDNAKEDAEMAHDGPLKRALSTSGNRTPAWQLFSQRGRTDLAIHIASSYFLSCSSRMGCWGR